MPTRMMGKIATYNQANAAAGCNPVVGVTTAMPSCVNDAITNAPLLLPKLISSRQALSGQNTNIQLNI